MAFQYEFINSFGGEIKVKITFDEWAEHSMKEIIVDFRELARTIDAVNGDSCQLEDEGICYFEEMGITHDSEVF